MAKTDTKARALERYGLTDEQLRAMLRNMLMQRQLDNRGFQLNRQGKVPVRARQRGPRSAAGRRGDGVPARQRHPRAVLSRSRSRARHRLHAVRDSALACSRAPQITTAAVSSPTTTRRKRRGMLSFSSIIAAHIPHAVGAAYAMQYRGENGSRRAGDVRRRYDERRRVARVDELRGDSQAADRVARREQRMGDLDAAATSRWRSRTSGSAPRATECRAGASTASIRSKRTAP